ncbi:hypothetical protein ACFLTZ_02365, partial [Chloroflexota bacterium]
RSLSASMLNYALVYLVFPLLTSSLRSKVLGLSGAQVLTTGSVKYFSFNLQPHTKIAVYGKYFALGIINVKLR